MGIKGHVDSSGYPLQIAVGNFIESQKRRHGFGVLYSEHAWKSVDGNSSGFADLVVSTECQRIIFVIECKRHLDAEWAFLVEGEEVNSRRHAKAFVHRQDEKVQRFEWLDLAINPFTPESSFCILPGDGNKKPIIERLAAELIESIEGIANEERELSLGDREFTRVYLPVIVTTAKLQVCLYKAEDISLATGNIKDPVFQEVPFLRFRKQVNPEYRVPEIFATLGRQELSRAKENTIFVVHSESINDFLKEIDVDPNSTNRKYLYG